jgi:hypothetical protein
MLGASATSAAAHQPRWGRFALFPCSPATNGRRRPAACSLSHGSFQQLPVCCKKRQRAAGTRRVHQPGHARARLDTADTPQSADCRRNVIASARPCPPVRPLNRSMQGGGRRFESVRGLCKIAANRRFSVDATCRSSSARWVWSLLGPFGRTSRHWRARVTSSETVWGLLETLGFPLDIYSEQIYRREA